MKKTIQYTNELSNFDINKIPLEQQICLLKASDSVKKIIVSGLVKNVYGQPLPGAIIKIKGTKNSTNTDQNGKYTIEVNQGEILIFSFLAKIDKELLVRNSKIINVVLHSGELLIGQVILK
jgi:hypothetical protein